jgi:hypothetical protein
MRKRNRVFVKKKEVFLDGIAGGPEYAEASKYDTFRILNAT